MNVFSFAAYFAAVILGLLFLVAVRMFLDGAKEITEMLIKHWENDPNWIEGRAQLPEEWRE